MAKRCKGCNAPKFIKSIGLIWFSDDGYCSVCNFLLKERKRTVKGMDNFVTTKITKQGSYDHLDRHGRQKTNKSILHEKISRKNRAMVIPSEYRKELNKGVKKIEEFI